MSKRVLITLAAILFTMVLFTCPVWAVSGDPVLEPITLNEITDITATASEINTPLDGALVTLTEFRELETIGDTTISANQWTLLGSLAETLTAAEVNILDGVTGVTAAELSYIGDVTSLIQAQLDLKAPLASPTFTGTVTIPTPFTIGAVSMTATGTELNYVDGVTSAIQTQIDTKGAHAGQAWTGAHDFGAATSVEIPNSAAPTVDAVGEIALDTTIANHKALLVYEASGTEDMTVIAIPTTDIVATDNYIIKYDLAGTKFTMEADVGGDPGSFGTGSAQTVATGKIDASGGANYVIVTGEGDAADAITEIQGAAVGDVIVFKGKTGLAYNLTWTDGTYLELQSDFVMNNQADTITLICTTLGANDTFTEIGRASNG